MTGIVEGGEVSSSLDVLVDLLVTLQSNLATPSHVLVGPHGWAELSKLKVADSYNTSLLGAGTTDAQRLLLSLPVIVTNALPGYDGLVVDSRAVVSATGQVKVATSVDTYFDTDSVGHRATWRTAHGVSRPNRLRHFTIAGGGS